MHESVAGGGELRMENVGDRNMFCGDGYSQMYGDGVEVEKNSGG